MEWIKIEEGCEMPEHNETVTVMDQGIITHYIVYRYGKFIDDYELTGVTHWLRITPPKD